MRSKIDHGKKPKNDIIILVIPIHSLMWNVKKNYTSTKAEVVAIKINK